MNATLLNINWLAVPPLGLASLFFLWLGLRRSAQFFNHESNTSQKERFRDLFLIVFNIISIVFCFLVAICPKVMWPTMIPVGFALCIISVLISILGSRLYKVEGFGPKNAGIKINSSLPGEMPDEGIKWYEFIPFGFMLGWLVFFLAYVAMLEIVRGAQELAGLETVVSAVIGTIAAMFFVVLCVGFTSKIEV